MTLQEYCRLFGWDIIELARQARINRRTASKAYHGQDVTRRVARKIAKALSTESGRTILVGEITGLNVKE